MRSLLAVDSGVVIGIIIVLVVVAGLGIWGYLSQRRQNEAPPPRPAPAVVPVRGGSYDDGEGVDEPDIRDFTDTDWVKIERLQAEINRIAAIEDPDEHMTAVLRYQDLVS